MSISSTARLNKAFSRQYLHIDTGRWTYSSVAVESLNLNHPPSKLISGCPYPYARNFLPWYLAVKTSAGVAGYGSNMSRFCAVIC